MISQGQNGGFIPFPPLTMVSVFFPDPCYPSSINQEVSSQACQASPLPLGCTPGLLVFFFLRLVNFLLSSLGLPENWNYSTGFSLQVLSYLSFFTAALHLPSKQPTEALGKLSENFNMCTLTHCIKTWYNIKPTYPLIDLKSSVYCVSGRSVLKIIKKKVL